MSEEPWHHGGLRFTCKQCGNCCTGGPGTVRVNDAEIAALARRLGVDEPTFRAAYTRTLRRGDVSLVEKRNYDCVFYRRGVGCTVYEDRPRQCRTWPFWSSVVHSREAWDEAAASCLGMNAGELHDFDEIADHAAPHGTSAARRGPT